ncbi:MAG TPA: DUF58 domain-containing protein [Candidatus Korarchaeota archaeon]|nr:DUF58 domain-containing protein [Candidatus Korarchaeota archaeon]
MQVKIKKGTCSYNIVLNSKNLCSIAGKLIETARRKAMPYLVGQTAIKSRGIGIEPEDYREYTHGDDFRFIDWRLSSRAIGSDGKQKFILRERLAEKSLESFFILDASASMNYKEKLAAAIYAISFLSTLALNLDDRITLVVAGNEKPLVLPHIDPGLAAYATIAHICKGPGPGGKANLEVIKKIVLRLARRRSPVILVTDMVHPPRELSNFLGAMRSVKNGVGIAFSSDRSEVSLPEMGSSLIMDPESGASFMSLSWQELPRELQLHRAMIGSVLRKWGIPSIELIGIKGAERSGPGLAWLYLSAREMAYA